MLIFLSWHNKAKPACNVWINHSCSCPYDELHSVFSNNRSSSASLSQAVLDGVSALGGHSKGNLTF